MLNHDCLALYLQFIINIILLIGLALFLKNGIRANIVLFVFLSGELMLELSDLICRFFRLNSFNTYNYPVSQFFDLILITKIYGKYFLRIPGLLKFVVYIFALMFLTINIVCTKNIKFVTFYSNIVSSIIVCGFAAVYFFNTFQTVRVQRSLFALNVSVFLFFSVESLISITFNFLISNNLKWVAPIWLFRGVLLVFFYIAIINLGCRIGKIRA